MTTIQTTARLRLREIGDASFRTFIESVRDYALLMLDPDGFVVSWNPGAEAIKGYAAAEILGQHFSVFYPQDSIASGLPERELVEAERLGRFEDEGWRVRKDGTRFWANVIITALRRPDGTLLGFAKVTRDLSERRRHEQALRLNETRFRALVESVREYAIIMLDADGHVASWNAGARRVFGYPASEVVGSHFARFFERNGEQFQRACDELAAAVGEGRFEDEGWRHRRDGSRFWASIVLTPIRDERGALVGFSNITRDLSERRHAEALADTARHMHEFIAMLAHELRNPLAPIRNAVALMARRANVDPLIDSMRLTIDRQSQNLTRIVDELLDVNRVARGQITIERQTLDLRDVLARAIETSRPLIDKHGHRLHVSIADQPIDCCGDPMRLTQVVVNLLNNAAKYTPDGGDIWLCAVLAGGSAEIRIRDNGRGIERASIERIFDLFMQVDPANGSALGGLGVGLALVRRIVDLHGGRVHAESDGLGRGSEFIVQLPADVAPRAGAIDAPRALPDGEPAPMRILVVDDNLDAANSLSLLLQSMGHELRVAHDGPSGIALVREFAPEVVMLDLGMPRMNGYDVARALRGEGAARTLVAVTGWGHEAAKRQARAAGFAYHLVKPVSESALIEVLTRISADRVPG